MPEEKVTLEQANEALTQIMTGQEPDEAQQPAPPVEEPQPETPETPAETPEAIAPETSAEDIESLRKRLTDQEAEYKSRTEAIQQRYQQNEQILRDRYVRKSDVAARAMNALKRARTEEGLDTAEADRLIAELQGTMNPASASYAPVQPVAPDDDRNMTLNNFLNEMRMSADEANEFGAWIQTKAATAMSPLEQAVASRDLDGFLRLAHNRFLQGVREQQQAQTRTEAVNAAKSVQRTQREAARAASSTPTAPRKQPPTSAQPVDLKKLTKNDISQLLQQSVQQGYGGG